jgi:hypothetical protein
VLGDRCQNMNCEAVGLREVSGLEVDAAVYEGRDERDVAGEAVGAIMSLAPWTRQAASASASFGRSLRLPLSISVNSATMRQVPPFAAPSQNGASQQPRKPCLAGFLARRGCLSMASAAPPVGTPPRLGRAGRVDGPPPIYRLLVTARVRLGEELKNIPVAKGTRGQLRGAKPGKRGRRGSIAGGAVVEPPAKDATLKELGVSKKQSAQAEVSPGRRP